MSGTVAVPLQTLLKVTEKGILLRLPFELDGERVEGQNGKDAAVVVSFKSLLSAESLKWHEPSLEDTLACCTGLIQLNPPRGCSPTPD